MKLPGFQNDEAGDYHVASEMIVHQRFPYMYTKPQGVIPGYLMTPFFLLIEDTVIASRLGNIFYAALSLIFLFCFVKSLFPGGKLPYFYIVFTAFHPNFILSARIGSETRTILMLFEALFLFFIYRWYKTGSVLRLVIAFLALGMGFASHICFAWFIVAMAILFVLFRPEKHILVNQNFLSRILKFYGPAMAALLIGASPYIYFFLRENLLLNWVLKGLLVTEAGVNNLAYFQNLKIAWKNFVAIVQGSYIFTNWRIELESFYNSARCFVSFFLIFVFSFVWLALSLFFKKSNGGSGKKKKVFLLLTVLLILAQSPFTLTQVASYHLLMLVPFVTLIMVFGFSDFTNFIKNKTIYLGLNLVFISLMLVQSLVFISRYYDAIYATGGKKVFTDAVYALSDWLVLRPELKLVCVDNRFDFSLSAITKGKINGEDRTAEFEQFLS
ncbi:MAG: glycosyltransferase family 39 protein, partial [Candidatus Omnitrophota bacterium]|nr:glycosyltransferase family 39 protein [Candidatus Omnitrophota bacterium]